MNALVAGNGSYIVWPCGHDLHGPTLTILTQNAVKSRCFVSGGLQREYD